MRNILVMLTALAASATATAQTSLSCLYQQPVWGAYNASAVAVDLDNNGYRDLVLAGIGSNITNYAGVNSWEKERFCRVALFNTTTKRWKIAGFRDPNKPDKNGLNVSDRPSLSACDINQDGIMDIVAFESSGLDYDNEPMIDKVSREGIFLGKGDGTFVQFTPTFIDAEGNTVNFDLRSILSADVADFNNDGLIDIVGIGYRRNGGAAVTYPEANVVLLNRGGGRFEVTHFLSDDYVTAYGQKKQKYHFECGQVQAYDFNNDGYVDFFVNANSNDRNVLGTTNGTSTHFSEIFLNDPEHPGQFRRLNIGSMGIPAMSEGGVAIADYNNDGLPDFFFSGWTGNGRQQYVWRVYQASLGTDGALKYTSRGNSGLPEMRNQNSTATQYGAMDWDGDGNFDIFNLGWSTRESMQTCFISLGTGTGSFKESARMGGGSEGCVAFIDWNGDGVNDFAMAGQTSDTKFYKNIDGLTRMFSTTKNPNAAPARPAAPTLREPVVAANGSVTLAWEENEASKKNVTFEYYVRDAEGHTVAGGNSFIGGDKDGVRKVNQPGNAYNSRTVTLHLPDGTYTYGVQTVDAALQGSQFATGKFVISGSSSEKPGAMAMPDDPDDVKPATGYVNPVINEDAPDPSVIRADDGTYYLYATQRGNNVVPVYSSKNLTNWTFLGSVFNDATYPSQARVGLPGNVWACDGNYVDGKYLLYYSKSEWGGEWTCGLAVSVADKPEGPYTNPTKLFDSSEIGVQNSIDPFFIEEDGHKYIFWGSFRGIYGIELSDDGMAVKTGATKKKIAGTLTEGTYIIKHDGYYYLVGSAGSCCDGANSTYHLVVARSKNLFGPYVDRVGKSALDNHFSSLLYRSSKVVGPGHCSEFVQDDAGQYWVLYHGYDASNISAGRKTYLDKVTWDEDGWPVIKEMRPSENGECEVPVIKTTAIEDINADSAEKHGIHLSSHMVDDHLTITSERQEPFSWQVVTIHGEKWLSGKAQNGATVVDTYAIPAGLYLVNIKTSHGSVTEKIIRKQ